MGVIAAGESRQRGHRRFIHPGPASGSPEGLVYNLERDKAGEQVDGRPAGSEQERNGALHAEHHQHRRCGFEVRHTSLPLARLVFLRRPRLRFLPPPLSSRCGYPTLAHGAQSPVQVCVRIQYDQVAAKMLVAARRDESRRNLVSLFNQRSVVVSGQSVVECR